MKSFLLATLICLFALSEVFGESPEADNIRMFLDFARFRYDATNTYLEIYYLLYDVNPDSLKEPKNIWLEFYLSDVNKDSLLASSQLKVILDPRNSNQSDFYNTQGSVIKTVLPVGRYMIKMIRFDQDKTRKLDSLDQVFSTMPFKKDSLALSDLELCCKIIANSQNTKGLFYKNTMEVVPNPMNMYGKEMPQLHYYIELYNVQSENPREEVKIDLAIADTEGQIHAKKSYTRKRSYESLVEVGNFDVSEFNNGLYTLVFAATDSLSNYSVYTRNNFYVWNQTEEPLFSDKMMTLFAQSEFFNMPEEVLDIKAEQIQYIASKNEMEIYKSLDDFESKRMFIFKFWYEKERAGVGLMDEYYSRIEYANQVFAYANIPGWKSDRGRVYVVYGEPDQINRHPHNPDQRPYVVWFYPDLEGGAKFLFVDESGFGDYKLKTSTLRGELYDPYWDELLLFDQ